VLFPDHDQEYSLINKYFPTIAAVTRDRFYNPKKEETRKEHRKITHRLGYNIPVTFLLGSTLILAITLTFIIINILAVVISAFLPLPIVQNQVIYLTFDPTSLFVSCSVGYFFGVFTHFWLDSTTRGGIEIRNHTFKGYVRTGKLDEEFIFAIMFIPILLLILLNSLFIFFLMKIYPWEVASVFSIVGLLVFLFLGVMLRSQEFYGNIVPTKQHERCDKLWVIKQGPYGYFWGHFDYDICNKTETIGKNKPEPSYMIETYPNSIGLILKFYFFIKPALIKIGQLLELLILKVFRSKTFIIGFIIISTIILTVVSLL
jgi:hypothetical protein